MSRPKIFISSTYFDLKSLREDLDRFIASFGYEPVRHEKGHISYGSKERPEAYAYREIENCDVLVSIIGGKFGSQAAGSDYSISQQELKKALDQGKQVYIFVERSVHNEFEYYKANKDIAGVRYTAVNDTRVYSFLEEVFLLPRGNPVFSFDTGLEIANTLREQLAGLFQRLLSQEANRTQTTLTEELQRSLQTVDQLVKYLTEEKTKGDQGAVSEILFSNHPIFEAVRKITRTKYRVYFTTLTEFNQWLKASRGYKPVDANAWDSFEYAEWHKNIDGNENELDLLFVKNDLFDSDGRLSLVSPVDWQESWVRTERRHIPSSISDENSDDIPF